MNKQELVERIANDTGMSKTQSNSALNATLDAIKGAMAKGEAVALPGFGNFQVKHRAARSGRNPATGDTIQIPAAKVPSFKAGKGLKDACGG